MNNNKFNKLVIRRKLTSPVVTTTYNNSKISSNGLPKI